MENLVSNNIIDEYKEPQQLLDAITKASIEAYQAIHREYKFNIAKIEYSVEYNNGIWFWYFNRLPQQKTDKAKKSFNKLFPTKSILQASLPDISTNQTAESELCVG